MRRTSTPSSISTSIVTRCSPFATMICMVPASYPLTTQLRIQLTALLHGGLRTVHQKSTWKSKLTFKSVLVTLPRYFVSGRLTFKWPKVGQNLNKTKILGRRMPMLGRSLMMTFLVASTPATRAFVPAAFSRVSVAPLRAVAPMHSARRAFSVSPLRMGPEETMAEKGIVLPAVASAAANYVHHPRILQYCAGVGSTCCLPSPSNAA